MPTTDKAAFKKFSKRIRELCSSITPELDLLSWRERCVFGVAGPVDSSTEYVAYLVRRCGEKYCFLYGVFAADLPRSATRYPCGCIVAPVYIYPAIEDDGRSAFMAAVEGLDDPVEYKEKYRSQPTP